jgi:hypothetical protein
MITRKLRGGGLRPNEVLPLSLSTRTRDEYLTSAVDRGSWLEAPTALLQGKEPSVPIAWETGWTPEVLKTRCRDNIVARIVWRLYKTGIGLTTGFIGSHTVTHNSSVYTL